MQLQNVQAKINEGKQEFQNNTYFLANYLKVNLSTRAVISDYITEKGELEGLRVLIDNNLEDGYATIGLGAGPTFSKIKFY